MYHTNLNHALSTQKIFSAGIKVFGFLKLSLKPGMYKNTDNKDWLTYVRNLKGKNLTVVDIGHHRKEYLFDMMTASAQLGKLIAFEPDVTVYGYLLKMKKIFRLKNVAIESLSIPLKTVKGPGRSTTIEKNAAPAATVIDMTKMISKEAKVSVATRWLDHYFLSNKIKPDLLKVKVEGNELDILKGSIQTLVMYKPSILLESRETEKSRERLLETFKLLTELQYSGYFILDTMKIPLSNFDFNIYQNETYGFYCNNFLFE